MSKPQPLKGADRRRGIELLRHFHKLGYSLRECGDPRRLRQSNGQLLALAREANLIFPDSVDLSLQEQLSQRRSRPNRRSRV
jgi:hypothetical protein